MNNNNKQLKRLLVFLYETFNGSQTLIMKEILENNLKADKTKVNLYLRQNKIKTSDYIAFFESKNKQNIEDMDLTNPVLCIKKEKKEENV